MKTFQTEPIGNGLFKIIVDGKELEDTYTAAQAGEKYAELWEESAPGVEGGR